MAGSVPGRRIRPTVAAAVSAGEKPGSSSCMPRTSPATSLAMGPMVSSEGDSGHVPSTLMRPKVVLSPAVPQQADGMRTLPPVSEP